MPRLAVFKNFKHVNLRRSRFLRQGEYDVWDAQLEDKAIRPFRCPVPVCEDAQDTRSLYPLRECECFGSTSEIAPIQGFTPHQHFFILSGRLRQALTEELCSGQTGCLAGVPVPTTPTISAECSYQTCTTEKVQVPDTEPPEFEIEVTCEGDSCAIVAVSYVATYISLHGGVLVESAPSTPTPVNAFSTQATIVVPPAPDDYCILGVNVYKAEVQFEDGTGSIPPLGAEYMLVDQVGVGGGTITDTNTETTLVLTTHDPLIFEAPLDIKYLARTEDGIAVADEHRVYISMPGQPMFATEGVVNIEDEIRLIKAIGNTIYVFTDKYPVLITYRVTEGMLSIKRETIYRHLPLQQIGSVSIYGKSIYFASKYALYLWSNQPNNIINQVMTRDQWAMTNDDVIGVAYEFGYLASSKSLGHSLMMEWEGEGRELTNLMPISYINADVMALDHDGHIMYVQDGVVYRWDYREHLFCDTSEIQDSDERNMCAPCECPYKVSLRFDNEGKNRFSVARIEWDERSDYKIDVAFEQKHFGANDTPIATVEVLSSRGFGLPRHKSAQVHAATLEGCGTITEVRFATSYNELVSSDPNNNINGER